MIPCHCGRRAKYIYRPTAMGQPICGIHARHILTSRNLYPLRKDNSNQKHPARKDKPKEA